MSLMNVILAVTGSFILLLSACSNPYPSSQEAYEATRKWIVDGGSYVVSCNGIRAIGKDQPYCNLKLQRRILQEDTCECIKSIDKMSFKVCHRHFETDCQKIALYEKRRMQIYLESCEYKKYKRCKCSKAEKASQYLCSELFGVVKDEKLAKQEHCAIKYKTE